MSVYRVRPRSCIADPELARMATVDLPAGFSYHRPETPQALVELAVPAVAALPSLRGPSEPERTIVMTLAPVPARSQR
jgi:hypothetical protein